MRVAIATSLMLIGLGCVFSSARQTTAMAAPPRRPLQLADDGAHAPPEWQERAKVWDLKPPSSEFALATHRSLAKAAVACSAQLVNAQYRQDILLQFDGRAHFDNCAFDDTFKYIDSEIAAIDGLPKTPDKAPDAMSHLGRILHAVQDFYAHSNWLELKSQAGDKLDPRLVVPVWTDAGRATLLHTAGLVTGYVWWDGPKRCKKDEPTHSQLNKDTVDSSIALPAWSMTGYGAALAVAEWASAELLRWAYARWPYLRQGCGDSLYVIATSDVRPQ
jgi:hypothetical protein